MSLTAGRWSLSQWLAGVVLVLPLLGLLGVVAAELVPDERIASELLQAREAGVIGVREWETGPLGTTTVHHSECLALSLGLGDTPGVDVVTTGVRSPTYPSCPRLDRQLTEYERTGALPVGHPYLRYWHGYSLITRPALALFGVAGARWIALGLLVLTMGAMYVDVRRLAGRTAAALLVAPPLLTSDTIIGGLSIVVALGTATAWFGGWLCFRLLRARPSWALAASAAALAGAANAYLDLMTTIAGAFTLGVVGAILGAGASSSGQNSPGWRIAGAATVGWAGGMAWMWVSKWLLAVPFLGVSAVSDDVVEQIFFRLSGAHEGVDPSRMAGLVKPLVAWWDLPLTPWLVLATVGVLVAVVAKRRTSIARRDAVTLLSVGTWVAVPHLLYYLVLNSHSQIHAALVYRSLPLAFGGLAACLVAAVAVPDRLDTV